MSTRNKWQLLSLQLLNVTEHDINLIFVVYSLDQVQMVWDFANSPVKELGGKKLFKRHRGANQSAGAGITLMCLKGLELSVGMKSTFGWVKL